jgi:hypothetical protein
MAWKEAQCRATAAAADRVGAVLRGVLLVLESHCGCPEENENVLLRTLM